jgi:hypothetical protein
MCHILCEFKFTGSSVGCLTQLSRCNPQPAIVIRMYVFRASVDRSIAKPPRPPRWRAPLHCMHACSKGLPWLTPPFRPANVTTADFLSLDACSSPPNGENYHTTMRCVQRPRPARSTTEGVICTDEKRHVSLKVAETGHPSFQDIPQLKCSGRSRQMPNCEMLNCA